jgi:hypothetical protein
VCSRLERQSVRRGNFALDGFVDEPPQRIAFGRARHLGRENVSQAISDVGGRFARATFPYKPR